MANQKNRKSGGNPLIWAAGLIAIYFAAKYWFGKKLQVQPVDITFTGSFLSPTIQVKFELYNPTSISSTLSNISGNILFNQNVIGSVTSLQTVVIPANSTQYIFINVVPSYIDILNSIVTLLGSGNKAGNNLEFDGFLTVDGFQFPFTQNVTL